MPSGGAAIVVVMAILALAAGLGGLFDANKTSPRALLKQALRSADPAWGVTATTDKQELRISRDYISIRIRTARAGRLPELGAGYGAALATWRETEPKR